MLIGFTLKIIKKKYCVASGEGIDLSVVKQWQRKRKRKKVSIKGVN